MKCKYCESELKPGAKFCPYCGKEVLEFDVCINCGKQIKVGASFCPHCGKNQHEVNIEPEPIESEPSDEVVENIEQPYKEVVNQQVPQDISTPEPQEEVLADTIEPYAEKQSSKKWVFIIVAVLLVGILGGGGYYFMSNKSESSFIVQEMDSIAEVSDSVISDIHSVKGIKSRLNEILSQALKMYDDEAVNKFFSQNFIQLYSQVKKNDATLDEPGFWCGSIWDGSQDDEPNGYEIVSVSTSSPTEAYVDVNLTSDYEGRHSERKMSMSLVFENENWFIDDILDFRYKDEMKKYIDSFEHESLISIEKMRNASIDETMPSQGFTKIYVPSEREGYGTDVWYKNCEIDKEGNVHSANENSCVVEVFYGMSASLRITTFDKTKFESIKEQVLEYSVKTDNRDYFKWKDNETTHLPISIGKSVNFKGGFFVEIPLD